MTPALVAEAELYEEMGRLYDPKYFQSAIDACNFLVKQYPGSSYRGEALYPSRSIQKDDLDQPDDAEATYQDYLKRFPRSQKAKQVREALKDIRDAELKDADASAKPAPATDSVSANAKVEAKDAADKDVGAAIRRAARGERSARRSPCGGRRHGDVKAVRTWNSQGYTRVVVMLGDTIEYKSAHIASPDRIYFDLFKARLDPKPKDRWTKKQAC